MTDTKQPLTKQVRDDAKKENTTLGRKDIPGAGVLTNTPGSPRVPSKEEMDKGSGGDGKDNRINLKKPAVDKTSSPQPKGK